MLIDKSVLAFIVTIVVGIAFTIIGDTMDWIELGNLFAIAIMGAFIIYYNDKKIES